MNEEIDNEESYSITPKGIAFLTSILETKTVPDEYVDLSVTGFLAMFVIATGARIPIPDNLMGREDLESVPIREMPSIIKQLKEALLNSVP